MKKVEEYVLRHHIPMEAVDSVKFMYRPEELAQIYRETNEGARDRHLWYYAHKLLPGFGEKYDDTKPRFVDNSGPTVDKEEREGEGRIAVQKNFLTGELAFALESGNLYMGQKCIESMCHNLSIFQNRDVFTTKSFSRKEWREMGSKVEVAQDVAWAMALSQLDNESNFAYFNEKTRSQVDRLMTNSATSAAILKLSGIILRDLLAGKDESVISPYYKNPSPIKKRFYNNSLIEGIIICHFPELWMDGETKFGSTHREIMRNIEEMAIEAQTWNGVGTDTAKKIAATSILESVRKFDY